jgi:hypothetical protein
MSSITEKYFLKIYIKLLTNKKSKVEKYLKGEITVNEL